MRYNYPKPSYLTVLSFVVGLLIPLFSYSQGSTAKLAGTVRDATGAIVAGAQISVKNLATNSSFSVVGDTQGNYGFVALPVGNYELTAEFSGFKRYVQTGIVLQVNENGRQDIVLQVGEVSQEVTVSSDATQVDTTSASLREVVDSKRIETLPLNGRNAATLIYLVAGVAPTSNDTSSFQSSTYPGAVGVSSSGSRGNGVNYLLDGGNNNDSYTNVNNPFPSPDALQEFSVQTNQFSAEYGRNAGAVVSAVSKSGSNQFHGSIFEYLRNSAVNASNFFSPDHASDGLKRNQYGATFGGPVWLPKIYDGHDKSFFFFSFQGTRIRQLPTTGTSLVPSAAERNGDFSSFPDPIIDPTTGAPFPGNQIPIGRFSPVTLKLLPMIPVPTDPSGRIFFSQPNLSDDDQYLGKVDHAFGTKDRLGVRYFLSDYYTPANITTQNILAVRSGRAIRNQSVVLNDTHVFSANVLNNFVFTYSRTSPNILSGAPFAWSDVGVDMFTTKPSELILAVTGPEPFSIASGHRSRFVRNTFHFADASHLTRGKHEFSFGLDIERQKEDTDNDYRRNGRFRFTNDLIGNGTAAFLLGVPTRFGPQGNGEYTAIRVTYYNFFFQDNIRLTPRLKLNLGLRYSPYFAMHDEKDRIVFFDPGKQSRRFPNAPAGMTFAGDPGVPLGGTSNDLNNLAPRIGFAYDVFGNGKTSVRGGYGIFYDQPNSIMIDNFVDIAPFSPQVAINVPYSFANPYHGRVNPFPATFPPPKDVTFDLPVDIGSNFEAKFRMPNLQSWNLTVEHELVKDFIARVSYVGSKGTHLLRSYDGDLPPYNPNLSLSDNIDSADDRRPFAPSFTEIVTIAPTTNSTYHSLQLTGQKRFSRGFTALASYTWSKSIDECSDFADSGSCIPNAYNVNDAVFGTSITGIPFAFRMDRAVSDYNIPHRFVLSYVWDLPQMRAGSRVARALANGWQFSGILVFQSGTPFSILAGSSGSLNTRPYLIGNPNLSSGRPRSELIQQYFNTAAFSFTDADNGTFGNSGRNILQGPGTKNWDASIMRMFSFTERYRLQFRADFFNLTNRVALRNPSNDLSANDFGQITEAGDPRILQFSLKFLF